MSYARFPAVLFDLDGTLTDPYVGITTTFLHALAGLSQPLPDETTLRSWIGPPLQDSFRTYLGGDEELTLRAVALYRERYRALGMYENRVYDGIPELLGALRVAGARLFVATSKLIGPAEGILEHFNLARYFDAIVGATPDERLHSKDQVIAATLDLLTPVERVGCVMVGDTAYDIEGARANSVPCIAVSYGYGTLASLHAAAPHAIVPSVDELGALLINQS
jgi:phosphoglycolate phosphatase